MALMLRIKPTNKRAMASPSRRLLSLGFVLIVLCMHHCSARKALMEDLNKQETDQPKADLKPAPMPESSPKLGQNNDTTPKQKGEIGLESCGGGCEPICIELPCPVIAGGGWVPTPPLITPQPPLIVPTPPIVEQQAPHYVPTPPIVEPQPPHLVSTPPQVVPQPPQVVPQAPLVTPRGPHWVSYAVPVTPCTPCEPWYGPGPCPCPCPEGAADMESKKTEPNTKAKEEGEMQMDDGAPSMISTANAPMPAMMDVHA